MGFNVWNVLRSHETLTSSAALHYGTTAGSFFGGEEGDCTQASTQL